MDVLLTNFGCITVSFLEALLTNCCYITMSFVDVLLTLPYKCGYVAYIKYVYYGCVAVITVLCVDAMPTFWYKV